MAKTSAARTPLVIVGGGPTGVTLAIELLRRGVPCRVLDRMAEPVATSRSFTVHAGTLELFEMAGYVEAFLERGLQSVLMDYRFQGVTQVANLDFTQLQSRYPYTLIINQNVTDEVLRNRLTELRGRVEWQTELQSATHESDGHVRAVLVHQPEGREEIVDTDWLTGCDGLRSVVRTQLGLEFSGDEYTGMEMRMMDVPLSGFSLGDDRIHYLISKERLLLITKLPGANYRVLISDMGDARKTETARAAFQIVVDDHFHGDVQLGEPEWATVFTNWRRISSGYRQGHMLLAGDAAHIHSPAGGQGMNACIQDPFNLGWKLALIARGEAKEALLDTYERERRPIAQQVIDGTHLLHAVIMAHGTSIEDRLAITRQRGFNQKAVRQISGVSYTYRNEVTVPSGIAPLDGMVAGDRAPDAHLTQTLRLHDLLRHPYYTLLVFARDGGSAQAYDTLATQVATRFGDRVRVHSISASGQNNDEAHGLYGIAGHTSLCLIRPDGYIGLRCRLSEQAALFAILDEVLI